MKSCPWWVRENLRGDAEMGIPVQEIRVREDGGETKRVEEGESSIYLCEGL